MTSSRPYLIRALYEWISDNGMTPQMVVEAGLPEVQVPAEYVEEGRILLNVAGRAVLNLRLGNERIEFGARFGGRPYQLGFPPSAVLAVYARENGAGMVFSPDAPDDDGPPGPEGGPRDSGPSGAGSRPSLRVVK